MPFIAHRVFGWQPVEIDESWGLKTIRRGMAYPLCNSVQCMECGFLFLDIRFSDEEMEALYHGYRDEEYTALREKYEPGYRARNLVLASSVPYLSEIERFLTPFVSTSPHILDWGGDTGQNTPFRTRGAQVDILDISRKDVLPGVTKVDRVSARETVYDLVVYSNILEHIPYPEDMLRDIAAIMREKTVLYIETPNEDLVRSNPGALNLHARKKHWHEHVNFFTRRSLETLIERCNLRIVALDVFEGSAGGSSAFLFMIACKRAA